LKVCERDIKIADKSKVLAECHFCDKKINIQERYDYCYQCGCHLCKECIADGKFEVTQISIQREDLLR
jgi:hypothetical protein